MVNWLAVAFTIAWDTFAICMLLWTLAFPLGLLYILIDFGKHLYKVIKNRSDNKRIGSDGLTDRERIRMATRYANTIGKRGEGPIEHYTTRPGPA